MAVPPFKRVLAVGSLGLALAFSAACSHKGGDWDKTVRITTTRMPNGAITVRTEDPAANTTTASYTPPPPPVFNNPGAPWGKQADDRRSLQDIVTAALKLGDLNAPVYIDSDIAGAKVLMQGAWDLAKQGQDAALVQQAILAVAKMDHVADMADTGPLFKGRDYEATGAAGGDGGASYALQYLLMFMPAEKYPAGSPGEKMLTDMIPQLFDKIPADERPCAIDKVAMVWFGVERDSHYEARFILSGLKPFLLANLPLTINGDKTTGDINAMDADSAARREQLKTLMPRDWSDYGDRARNEAFSLLKDMAKEGAAENVPLITAALDKLSKVPVTGHYNTEAQLDAMAKYNHERRNYNEYLDGCRDCRSTPPGAAPDMTLHTMTGAEEAKDWRTALIQAAPDGSPVKTALSGNAPPPAPGKPAAPKA